MQSIGEPYVVRHLVGQRPALKEIGEMYDLRPIHLEILAIIYALNDNNGYSDCIGIAKAMGGHPKNLLYLPLRELRKGGYIEVLQATVKKRKKRGFNPDIYSMHQRGIEVLVQYVKLIKKYGTGF